ncbi:hypothetical protein ABZ260_27050 [Streptosporangium sp. NPDC006013]|uniref:hypothetical protein n=1 Tax=Streptosporangium sp. NPDC006013 TaxID=3155596 RepID=UPI00339F57B5
MNHGDAEGIPLTSAVFADDEPVLQSHPLVDGVAVPVFADALSWSLEATRKPANLPPSHWRIQFANFDAIWGLRAREIAMALLNPEHPTVVAAKLHLDPQPAQVTTVRGHVHRLTMLARWAAERGLSHDLRAWHRDEARAFIERRRHEGVASSSLVSFVGTLRLLHKLGPLLTGGGLAADPWPGRTNRQVAEYAPTEAVTTRNIAPEVWFALVRAAWTYLSVFAPDILAARRRHRKLLQEAVRSSVQLERHLDIYLADPANRVPLHTTCSPVHCVPDTPNWHLTALLLGSHPDIKPFGRGTSSVLRARTKVEAAVAAGRGVSGGLLGEYVVVERPDGSAGPWHPGLCPRTLAQECLALRGAAYIFVAALSMMRDSEIREITRGSVVEHYGAPALVSTKRKLDTNRPREHWWIIEPVAEAIAVAEELSSHEELVFASEPTAARVGGFDSRSTVLGFIDHVNSSTDFHGLHIPAGRVTPHMLRKTMAMLTGTEPGAEIALGIQLKHVATRMLANRVTQGYAATDTAWSKMLDNAVDQARFTRLSEFYDDYHAGKTIGFGPGVGKVTAAFDAVKEAAREREANGLARQGDARVEYDLLRKARISIRFGTLNHCTMDDNNPVGAKCLEDEVIVPDGHRGPLQDRCRPGRCANSVIGPEHLPIWTAEKNSLLRLLDVGKLPPPRRIALQRQLDDAQAVIDRTESKKTS